MEDKSTGGTTSQPESTPRRTRWDTTLLPSAQRELAAVERTSLRAEQTPSRFSETPLRQAAETPRRWEGATPLHVQATPNYLGATPNYLGATPSYLGATPNYAGATPTPGSVKTADLLNIGASKLQQLRWERELAERNRSLSDEELNEILPGLEDGFEIVKAPEGYQSLHKPPAEASFELPEAEKLARQTYEAAVKDLPPIKPEEVKFFGPLLERVDEEALSIEELKERKILTFLLKIKDGDSQMRRAAMKAITLNARELGAGPLFNSILPLLMATKDPQQRHLLVKVIDRVLYKLDELVRPFVKKILTVILPLLIEEDYYARMEGREVVSNLAKAAGLPTMITTLRPDLDSKDELVRNMTSRALAVSASALGLQSMLPFLKAVCLSKKSWEARYTGVKAVQQIAILLGCSILPYLRQLVETIRPGLDDAQKKIRSMTALAVSALAEASAPYGIEAFSTVLEPLWRKIHETRDRSLGAFLKAVGFIIPLMESKHALQYIHSILPTLVRQFETPEEELRKIILKVVKQVVACPAVDAEFIRKHLLEDFFRHFWTRRLTTDRRNYRPLIETTCELATKVGVVDASCKIYLGLKDENEAYRKMVMEALTAFAKSPVGGDFAFAPESFRNELMDAVLVSFHEQTTDDNTILEGFGAIVNALGQRAKPYFVQIVGTLLWRLNNKAIRVRQQAAELVARIAQSMKRCNEEARLGRLGLTLNEGLREEYPEVLGSILGALRAIVAEVGMAKMTPPIKVLLPRLTPILKNRNEKVQENCIDLVGCIAAKGAEDVPPKEWIRICFDLLEMLKAHRKSIRRAAVLTFGHIARAIGPQDVLVTLLNNLKVQERQLRICTTVAIAIVAESCGPFTVLPALMNEYRVQDLNVQNGVLKSLSFMFEYVGEMAKDYVYAITPLLEDALTDRDLVHRQTATNVVKHLALGVQGFGCEDAIIHLLNFIWPNIFENSPHLINSVLEALEAIRLSAGPAVVLLYTLQGLWHPARKVRHIYWRIYNFLYVSSQHALVPFHPPLAKDPANDYSHPELLTIL